MVEYNECMLDKAPCNSLKGSAALPSPKRVAPAGRDRSSQEEIDSNKMSFQTGKVSENQDTGASGTWGGSRVWGGNDGVPGLRGGQPTRERAGGQQPAGGEDAAGPGTGGQQPAGGAAAAGSGAGGLWPGGARPRDHHGAGQGQGGGTGGQDGLVQGEGGTQGASRSQGTWAQEDDTSWLSDGNDDWLTIVGKMGKKSSLRESAEYREGEMTFRTRADSYSKGNLNMYCQQGTRAQRASQRTENKSDFFIKIDWECMCKQINFQRNTWCRKCNVHKSRGCVRKIETRVHHNQTGGGRERDNVRVEASNHDKALGGGLQGEPQDRGQAQEQQQRHGQGRVQPWRARAASQGDGEAVEGTGGNALNPEPRLGQGTSAPPQGKAGGGTKVLGMKLNQESMRFKKGLMELKFVKQDARVITVEEVDEALNSEGKDDTHVKGVMRKVNGATLLLKDSEEVDNWNKVGGFPIKVSSTAIYLGATVKNKSEGIKKVKLSGVPPWVSSQTLVRWLSFFGEVRSNIRVKQIKKTEVLNNIGGVIDLTNMEVDVKLTRDLREKEYLDGDCIRVHYEGIPKTCFSCKMPGNRCPTGGGASYACKLRKPEVNWEVMYTEEEKIAEAEKDSIEERCAAARAFDFEAVETSYGDNQAEDPGNPDIPEGFKIAGIRFKSKEVLTKEQCVTVLKSFTAEMRREGEEMSKALDEAVVLDEEMAKGKIRAFNVLLDTNAAHIIWEHLGSQPACSPILMTRRRWKEEQAMKRKKELENQKEQLLRQERMAARRDGNQRYFNPKEADLKLNIWSSIREGDSLINDLLSLSDSLDEDGAKEAIRSQLEGKGRNLLAALSLHDEKVAEKGGGEWSGIKDRMKDIKEKLAPLLVQGNAIIEPSEHVGDAASKETHAKSPPQENLPQPPPTPETHPPGTKPTQVPPSVAKTLTLPPTPASQALTKPRLSASDLSKSQVSSQLSRNNQQKGGNKRCGKCIACKDSCEGEGRDPSDWCDICKKKKLGDPTHNKACKKRKECNKVDPKRDREETTSGESPDSKKINTEDGREKSEEV